MYKFLILHYFSMKFYQGLRKEFFSKEQNFALYVLCLMVVFYVLSFMRTIHIFHSVWRANT